MVSFVETDDPDVILGAAFGEDVALTRVGGDVLVSHVDPIVGAIGNIGWLAVHVACNDIATSGAQIGDHVLVTKGIALEGTAILAQDFSDIAQKLGLGEEDLEKAHDLMSEVSVVPEALVLAEHGATAMHDVTRGGLLETLLEIAYLSEVGIEVDASQLPIRPLVARFAQAFRFDPLRMISSGTLATTLSSDRVADVRGALTRMGVLLADVGRVTDGLGVRLVRKEETIHYHQIRCEEDELARMWALYPRNE